MKYRILPVCLSLAALFVMGCDKEDDISDTYRGHSRVKSSEDYSIHKFVHETFSAYYYWADNVPQYMDYSQYATPEDVLESFRVQQDRFSFLTDSYSEMEKSFNNDYTTDGLNYNLTYVDDSKSAVVAIVNYVYDNSPAKKAGMKRGDIIYKVNGNVITADNYSDLLSQNTLVYTYRELIQGEDGQVKLSDNDLVSEKITKIEMQINPVLQTNVITIDNHRVGYFLYDGFTSDTKIIMKAIETLEAQQVTDLVLDLRLNGGGYVSTLDTLASMLVPSGNEGNLFIEMDYNDMLKKYLEMEEGLDFNKEKFVKISPKLELSTLYVLVSGSSASASEELISGLSPYMKVVLIGETTYGKFTTNTFINFDEKGYDSNGTPYTEWAAYVSIACCKNSKGEMNFANGFKPDYEVSDDYVELGSENEPLLKQALTLISGGSALTKKAEERKPLFGEKIASFGKPEITKSALIKTLVK
ncbi:MAG: PDZ domain-containing protein [Bacteroidales bacterium]|nr:PDZ domain-containing protein [Bacteroidales bacterium]